MKRTERGRLVSVLSLSLVYLKVVKWQYITEKIKYLQAQRICNWKWTLFKRTRFNRYQQRHYIKMNFTYSSITLIKMDQWIQNMDQYHRWANTILFCNFPVPGIMLLIRRALLGWWLSQLLEVYSSFGFLAEMCRDLLVGSGSKEYPEYPGHKSVPACSSVFFNVTGSLAVTSEAL